MKRIAIRVVVALGAVGIGVVGIGESVSANYPPDGTVITVTGSDSSTGSTSAAVVPGGTVNVTVGCNGSELVEIEFNDQTQTKQCQPVSSATSRNGFALSVQFNGIATATFTAPSQPGDYTVVARLLTTGITLTGVVTVAIPAADVTIPKVGGGDAASEIIRVAGGLLLVGASMSAVAGGRRRAAKRDLVDTAV